MEPTDNAAILRRKIGEQSQQAELSGMTPRKALRLAIARAAQDFVSLEIRATGCQEQPVSVGEIVETLAESALILLLEGPERSLGLAIIDQNVLSGLVEFLTTGRVIPSAPEPRKPTRTDAMMISELLNETLSIFDAELNQIHGAQPLIGFRQLLALEDSHAVAMALEEMPYRQFRLTVDLDGGAKSGDICLCFPKHRSPKSEELLRKQKNWQETWHHHVMGLHAPIEAIIHRLPMSVSRISNLQIGDLIPIPAAQIAAVSLEGSDCCRVATGKLGQSAGFRAIRIGTELPSRKAPFAEIAQDVESAAPLPQVQDQSIDMAAMDDGVDMAPLDIAPLDTGIDTAPTDRADDTLPPVPDIEMAVGDGGEDVTFQMPEIDLLPGAKLPGDAADEIAIPFLPQPM